MRGAASVGVRGGRSRFLVAVAATVALAAGGDAVAKARYVKRAKKPRPAPTASSDAEGRSHLKKGKALASHGDCKAAIEELTKAFDILNDPEVLLPRADCFQRLGLSDEAVGDYRAYLDESPDVRNRSEIEAKIAALEGAPSPPKEKPRGESAVAPAPKENPRGESAPPPVARPVSPVTSPATRPVSPGAVTPPTTIAPLPPQIPASPPPVVEIEVGQAPAQAAEPAAGAPRRWWLWTTLAVLAAGGAVVGGYFAFRPADPMTTGTLGSYHF